MIDVKFIRENPEKVKEICRKRNMECDVDRFNEEDLKFRKAKLKNDELNALKNRLNGKENAEKIKNIKKEIKENAEKMKDADEKRKKIWYKMPNLLSEKVPYGITDKDNAEIFRTEIKYPEFIPEMHDEIGKKLGILDMKKGAQVAGKGFYYWKGAGAILMQALINYGINFLIQKNFIPMFTPIMTIKDTLFGTGYHPFFEEESYKIENEKLYLIGTSEQTLIAYHMNETLREKDMPKLYTAYTPCFRTEAGAYGKENRGAFRAHQFNKVEQIAFTVPEESEKYHMIFLENVKEFIDSLRIPYRIVNVCSGDLGAPAYLKYDVEAWFPGFGDFRETHSASNMWDYQARRMNIKYLKNNKLIYPHTVNSTLVTDRLLLAIIENYQKKDGNVEIPEVLHTYTGGLKIIKQC